ncbi:enolase-phosphatase E1-like [Parasteatoda tepidariorum]|uniref:enolase-phosphatase E1-like n=1 Tax=Parasteatoda tepidariorum TaxID=114398 RepID=UPI0039BC4199
MEEIIEKIKKLSISNGIEKNESKDNVSALKCIKQIVDELLIAEEEVDFEKKSTYDLRSTPSRLKYVDGFREKIKYSDDCYSVSKEADAPIQQLSAVRNGIFSNSAFSGNESNSNSFFDLRRTPSRILRQNSTTVSSPYDKKAVAITDEVIETSSEEDLKRSDKFNATAEMIAMIDKKDFIKEAYDLRNTPSREIRKSTDSKIETTNDSVENKDYDLHLSANNEDSASRQLCFTVQDGNFGYFAARGNNINLNNSYDLRLTPSRILRRVDTTVSSTSVKNPEVGKDDITETFPKEDLKGLGKFDDSPIKTDKKEFLRETYDLRSTPMREIRQKTETSSNTGSENEARSESPVKISKQEFVRENYDLRGTPMRDTRQKIETSSNTGSENKARNESPVKIGKQEFVRETYDLRGTPMSEIRQKIETSSNTGSENEARNESPMKTDKKESIREAYDLRSTPLREIRQKMETSSNTEKEKEAKSESLEINMNKCVENPKELSTADNFLSKEHVSKPFAVSNFSSKKGKKVLFNENSVNKLTDFVMSSQFGEKIKKGVPSIDLKENHFEAPL